MERKNTVWKKWEGATTQLATIAVLVMAFGAPAKAQQTSRGSGFFGGGFAFVVVGSAEDDIKQN